MAQRTRANFKSTKNIRFTTNGTGAITGPIANEMFEDAADSFVMFEDLIESQEVVTSGAISLNFLNNPDLTFYGDAQISANKVVTFDNATNALRFTFLFDLSSTHSLTLPSTVIMDDIRWNNSTKIWTALNSGKYKMTGIFDETNWWVDISQNNYI